MIYFLPISTDNAEKLVASILCYLQYILYVFYVRQLYGNSYSSYILNVFFTFDKNMEIENFPSIIYLKVAIYF